MTVRRGVGEAVRNWMATALIVAAPAVYFAWLVLSDGRMIHPIDIGLAAGPWACTAMALLGTALVIVALIDRTTTVVEEAILWAALVIAMLEIPVFALTTIGAALGIGAPA